MAMADRFRHFAVEQLADGVWAAIRRIGPPAPDAWSISNAGIVDLAAAPCVRHVHDQRGCGGAAVGRRGALRRPPETVVLNHGHNDHAWGASQFPDATIVSAARARGARRRGSLAAVQAYRDVLQEPLAFSTAAADGDDPLAREDAPFFLPYWQGLAEACRRSGFASPTWPSRAGSTSMATRGGSRS